MQIVSSKYSLHFGQFTMNGQVKANKAEEAIKMSADLFSVPKFPEKEMKVVCPSGLFNPEGKLESIHLLTGGASWLGVGVCALSNTPNA